MLCGVGLFESTGGAVALSISTQANQVYSTWAIPDLPEEVSRNLYSSHRAGFGDPLISISI